MLSQTFKVNPAVRSHTEIKKRQQMKSVQDIAVTLKKVFIKKIVYIVQDIALTLKKVFIKK